MFSHYTISLVAHELRADILVVINVLNWIFFVIAYNICRDKANDRMALWAYYVSIIDAVSDCTITSLCRLPIAILVFDVLIL